MRYRFELIYPIHFSFFLSLAIERTFVADERKKEKKKKEKVVEERCRIFGGRQIFSVFVPCRINTQIRRQLPVVVFCVDTL